MVGDSGWLGRLDELAVYDKALGADRIKVHYTIGSAPP